MPKFRMLSPFNFGHSYKYVCDSVSQCPHFLFFMADDVEYLFMCLLSLYGSFAVDDASGKIFAHLKLGFSY